MELEPNNVAVQIDRIFRSRRVKQPSWRVLEEVDTTGKLVEGIGNTVEAS